MENGLREKLDRVTNTIDEMKVNLRLDNNAPIEEIAEATNLKTLTNVFIQPNEPEIKDGIWIQATEEQTFDAITMDDNAIIPGKWRFDLSQNFNPAMGTTWYIAPGRPHHVVYLNDALYIMNASSARNLLKYDLTTQAISKLTASEYVFYDMVTNGVDKIFLMANQWVETFDITTNTSTKVKYYDSNSYSGSAWRAACYSAYDNHLYLLSPTGTSNLAYFGKVNVDTGAYTRIATYGPNGNKSYLMLPHDNEIILLSGEEGFPGKVYNIDDSTLTNITNYSIKDCHCGDRSVTCDFGNYHYVFDIDSYANGSTMKGAYKIDKDTLEFEDVTDQFNDPDLAPMVQFFNDGQRFYAFSGTSDVGSNGYNQGKIVPMDMESSQYDKNTVVIVQSAITRTPKQTALWTYPFLEGRLNQPFYDVYYYNKDTGFDFTLPMYYGDGEKWIKFKN